MILRRLAQHLREQNWTAIFIEFVLLVLGVFLGIQVANWNEDRQSRGQERELLQRLRIEIEQNIDSTKEKAGFFDTVYGAADRTYAFLGSDAPCENDCWLQLVSAFNASQWRDLRPRRDTFEEMERIGLPRDRQLKFALSNYYGLYDSMVTITTQLPEYRARVRSHIPPKVQLHLWRNCHRIEGLKETLVPDCPEGLAGHESMELGQRLRADTALRPALVYWMSTLALIQPALDQQILAAEAVIASIDSQLER